MRDFPPFRLDLVNQCLWRVAEGRAGERVALAPRAFDVLRYLVEHPGRLVPHDELLEALWPGVHVQPEVVKGHILTVRTALGDSAEAPRYIETVRGRGYSFIAPVGVPSAAPDREAPERRQGLVGRDKPMGELHDSLRDVLAGQAQVVFVIGEPGIGKTALLEEFLAQPACLAGIVVARGQCVEGFGGTEPYYPVLDALGRLCEGPMGADARHLLVKLAPTWAIQLPAHIPPEQRKPLQQDAFGARQERMLREICELLEALSQRRPLVIAFEDMHWADYSTVDLLSAIARRRCGARLMVVATYRPEDAVADFHPVKQLSQALRLRKLCREIVLEPLSEQAVADYLEQASDGLARLVRERSGGNPLFMTATLDHLQELGLIDRMAQGWRVQGALAEVDFDVPLTLSQVIENRIQRLTEDERRVLQAACIVGATFSARIAAAAAGMGAEAFEDVCEELCRKDSFIRREGGGPVYAFQHVVYRQVLIERQGPLRRARLHRAIGETLEAAHPPEGRSAIASELAQHFAAAEDWARALSYLRVALRTAKQRFAHLEVLEILKRAGALAIHLPQAARLSMELEILECEASIFAATHDPRAADAYRRFANAAETSGQIDAQARALLGLAYAVGWRDKTRCVEVLDQALALSDRQSDKQCQARTRVSGHTWRIWARGWDETDRRNCEAALAILDAGTDRAAAAWAHTEYSMIKLLSSRYQDAIDEVSRGYQALFDFSEDSLAPNVERAVWMRHVGVPWAHLHLGKFEDSEREFEHGLALFARNGHGYAAIMLRLYRGLLLFHGADFAGLAALCREVLSQELLPAERRMCLLLAGLAEAGLGNEAAAEPLLSEVEDSMRREPVIFDWYWRILLEWGQADLALAAGRLGDARRHADRFVQLADATEERTWRGLAWETNARVALAEGRAEAAAGHIETARGVIAGFAAPLAEQRIGRTAALLE